MAAFNKAWDVVKKRTSAQKCEIRIDEYCMGKADRIVTDFEQRVYACGPCSDHAPGNATVEVRDD
tara:strand:+ start:1032 stop:1226 length:195 start_codon:yes stop_codon:yes gene_type:complete